MMRSWGLALAVLLTACLARAEGAPHWVGDLGVGIQRTQTSAPGAVARTWLLPYAYGELGPLFVREDTFGAKMVPIGWGALELVGRFSTEGSDGGGLGIARRGNPRPVGLGTFQETPWGGFFVDAFFDMRSRGTLLEASYAVEIPLGPATLYPQAGVVRRSARYEAHLYDVPIASTTSVLEMSAELPIAGSWIALAHIQYEPFGRAVRASPRVNSHSRTSMLAALAWRFK